MNRKMIICGILVCSVLTTVFLSGCKKNSAEDVQRESAATLAETQVETQKEETLPPEMTDPTGHYVYGGTADSVWDDEEVTETSAPDKKDDTTQNTEKPSETEKPNETTKPTEETKPSETTTPTETTATTEPDAPDNDDVRELTEYEKYMAMSAEAQQEYFNSFESVEAFFQWLQEAKEEYEESLDYVEIGGGPIDIQGILEGNGK